MSRPIPMSNEIQAYCHCGSCLADRPPNVSPAEWAKLAIGWTKLGLQVWCERCSMNVLHIDFQGQKHPASTSAIGPRVDHAPKQKGE